MNNCAHGNRAGRRESPAAADELPRRIQLKRTKGWRMPPNTVKVTRPHRWGNNWKIGSNMWDHAAKKFRVVENATDAVEAFRNSVDWDPDAPYTVGNLVCLGGYGPEHRNRKTIRSELRGKNLACWCPIGSPCHADVLLELANSAPGGSEAGAPCAMAVNPY